MTVTREELRALKPNKHVVLDRAGVDAWGIYIGMVSKWHETRVFVVGNMVCKYSRSFTSARTTWKSTLWPNTEAAMSYASKAASSDSIIVGSPILVQLTDSDVALIKAGKMPNARYRGQARHELINGKVLDATSYEHAKVNAGAADFHKVVAARPLAKPAATPGIAHAVASATSTMAPPTHSHTMTGTLTAASGATFTVKNGDVVVAGPVGDEPF